MYKTVRKGETSLQYHILPQDDVTSGHVMKRRRSSRHRTAFILVLTLILGCAIVAAAVLIPVLMTSTALPLPARFQTFAVAASSVNVRPHGKYTLQGTQYIALLPVKDSLGHFNAYQLKPSMFTTTTTPAPTSTTRGVGPTGEARQGEWGALPRWVSDLYNTPWTERKVLVVLLCCIIVAKVVLVSVCCLRLCLRYYRSKKLQDRDKGMDSGSATLLTEVSTEE